MRVILSALVLLIAASIGAAAGDATRSARVPPLPPRAEIHLPIRLDIPPWAPPRAPGLPLRLESHRHWDMANDHNASVSLGPLQAQLGGSSTEAHLARYRLNGMDVLGGSVSGTFDGRGARVYVRWPPSDDD